MFSIFKAFASKGFLGFSGNNVQNIMKLPERTNEIPIFWTCNPEEGYYSGTSNKKILKIGAGRDHLISWFNLFGERKLLV